MIYLVAIVLRLWGFDALQGTDELAKNLSYPPLYRWLDADTLWFGRTISLLAGMYVVYVCSRFGRLPGYLTALSPTLIEYSRLAQPDMLMTALVVGSLLCNQITAAVPLGIAIATKWNAGLAFVGYCIFKARDWRILYLIVPIATASTLLFAFPVLLNPSGYLDRLMYEAANQKYSLQNGSTYLRFFQFIYYEPYAVTGFALILLHRQWRWFWLVAPMFYCGWQPKGDIHYCLWVLPVLAIAHSQIKWNTRTLRILGAVVVVEMAAIAIAYQIKPEDPRIAAKAWIEGNLPTATIGLYGGEYAPKIANRVIPLVVADIVDLPEELHQYLTNPKYLNMLSRVYINPPEYVLLCSAAYERFYQEEPEHPPERYYYQQNRRYLDRLLQGEVVKRWGKRPHILLIRTR